jgi:MFS family permease
MLLPNAIGRLQGGVSLLAAGGHTEISPLAPSAPANLPFREAVVGIMKRLLRQVETMQDRRPHWSSRLPFYYGWVIVGIAFVTMAVGVTARTTFSLLMPPLTDEFHWDRGLAAGAFSFGFLVSAAVSPIVGRALDLRGPRGVILCGVMLTTAGLFLAPYIERPWHLYATLGVLVGGGANMMTYTVHSQFLPNWFVARRGLAISIAFAGAGIGAIILLPWLQSIILHQGWRVSCWALGLLVPIGRQRSGR